MEELPQWKHELPKTPHKLLNDTFNVVVEYYKEHLQRDTSNGRLMPTDAWVILRGFLIAAAQTYAAICLLVADKRPKPLMLQANVLTRALFEILATVLALTEAPRERSKILSRDAWKAWAVRLKHLRRRFGTDPKRVEYLEPPFISGLPERAWHHGQGTWRVDRRAGQPRVNQGVLADSWHDVAPPASVHLG